MGPGMIRQQLGNPYQFMGREVLTKGFFLRDTQIKMQGNYPKF
jgi:hypothetical protein